MPETSDNPDLGQIAMAAMSDCPQLIASGLTVSLLKELSGEAEPSKQGYDKGEIEPPFNFSKAKALLTVNAHHSTCVYTKRDSTVGMGFVTPELREARKLNVVDPKEGESASPQEVNPVETEADRQLDPLCDESFQEILSATCEDYWNLGQGYIEVVRSASDPVNGEISSLWYLPAEDLLRVMEGPDHRYHFKLLGGSSLFDSADRRFVKFGDKERFLAKHPSYEAEEVSEVIVFRRPSSLHRWYGFPDWLAGVADIELQNALRQYKYDFFYNRGVPEMILSILGHDLTKDQWDAVNAALKANVGVGNTHRSLALNLPNPEAKVQVDKLMLEKGSTEEEFITTKDSLDMSLVTAHRVPPLLANIMIPGKMGALNELPNSLMSFQILVLGPAQRLFQRVLGQSLGNKAKNGGLPLNQDDFELRRVTDIMDPMTMDTIGRMRQSLPEAQAEGRDLEAGTKD